MYGEMNLFLTDFDYSTGFSTILKSSNPITYKLSSNHERIGKKYHDLYDLLDYRENIHGFIQDVQWLDGFSWSLILTLDLVLLRLKRLYNVLLTSLQCPFNILLTSCSVLRASF